MATVKKLPGVLAFARSFVITDGAMYNDIGGKETPLLVVEHGIRATQNVSPKTEAAVGDKERSVAQIQITQTAKTDNEASGMIVRFGLRMTDMRHSLHSCTGTADDIVRESIESFIQKALNSDCPKLVASRIARNIANGRWLWRNRMTATSIKISVFVGKDEIASFDAFKIPMNGFDKPTQDEQKVADVLADGLSGKSSDALEVVARVEYGVTGSVEVFPSQPYVENKKTGFARPLYKIQGSVQREPPGHDGLTVVGQAGLRDHKISNALKTIDTWYPDFELENRVISIEPNGANLESARFYRPSTGKSSAFSMLGRLDDIDPVSDEGLYAFSIMMRGGVMGESDKKG